MEGLSLLPKSPCSKFLQSLLMIRYVVCRIAGSTFASNTVEQGALYLSFSTAAVTASAFSNNVASGLTASGGAVYCQGNKSALVFDLIKDLEPRELYNFRP